MLKVEKLLNTTVVVQKRCI